MMKIKSATFLQSGSTNGECPQPKKYEFAFIGRSNVGKSSLINMLADHKGLAMTSSTPGKTQCINHFVVNNDGYIVDLPGYGYAKCGKDARERLQRVIEDYILGREEMTLLFVLIDSRHSPQKIDTEFMAWLGECGVPFAIVFTKGDKNGAVKLAQNIGLYKKELLKEWEELPPIFVTSSTSKQGKEELLAYMGSIIKNL